MYYKNLFDGVVLGSISGIFSPPVPITSHVQELNMPRSIRGRGARVEVRLASEDKPWQRDTDRVELKAASFGAESPENHANYII